MDNYNTYYIIKVLCFIIIITLIFYYLCMFLSLYVYLLNMQSYFIFGIDSIKITNINGKQELSIKTKGKKRFLCIGVFASIPNKGYLSFGCKIAKNKDCKQDHTNI